MKIKMNKEKEYLQMFKIPYNILTYTLPLSMFIYLNYKVCLI